MHTEFQFVAVSNPAEPASAKSRTQSRSHAIRQAHAKERRLRMERYQKRRAFEAQFPGPLSHMLAGSKDPFSSMARTLSSEEYFLLHHYIKVTMPYVVGHCGLFDYPGDHQSQMLREWVGLAVTNENLMVAAVLLGTCRSILRERPDSSAFTKMALQYKQICLRTLRQEISDRSSVSVITIATALALASDDVNVGEHAVARKHLEGVITMVQVSGGPKQLGLTGLLERMYYRHIMALTLSDSEVDLMCQKH